jgi:hypothetical protein
MADWAKSLHESSHFCAALLLRGEVAAVVSIRPSKAHGGATILGSPARVNFSGRRDNPLGVDPEWRRDVERLIVVLLVGKAAEDLAGRPVGRIPDPAPGEDEQRAAALAQSLAELAPQHMQLLTDSEAGPAPDDSDVGDDLHAFELSWRLTGLEAQFHLAWLRAVAERFVLDHAVEIVAVARELYRRTVMPGADAAAIVHRIREEEADRQPAA